MTFNKENLVETISEVQGVTKADANRHLDNVMAGIQAQLGKMEAGDKLQLVGKITFEKVHKPAHDSVNPRTKEPVKVPAKNAVKVKAGSDLVKAVN